jgi:hypothetical protein
MPKRLATTSNKARPSASNFKVNTKRKFGAKTFEVKTRKAPNSVTRIKYWAVCKPSSSFRRKLVLSKRKPGKHRNLLKGGGEGEVIQALRDVPYDGQLERVCQVDKIENYIDQLKERAESLAKLLNQNYAQNVDDFFNKFYDMVTFCTRNGVNKFANIATGQAFETIRAIINYYSKQVTRKKQLDVQYLKFLRVYVPYHEDDNVYQAIRAFTGLPLDRVLRSGVRVSTNTTFKDLQPKVDERFTVSIWHETKK